MEVLTDLVRNVVVIILLTTFLDMLLPSNSMQPFVKVVMGLFILISVLTPVLTIFTSSEDFTVFDWHQPGNQDRYTTVLQDGNRLTTVNQELLLQNYALRVEKQMEALVKLVKGVKEAQVVVQLHQGKETGALEGISSAQVMVSNKEDPKAQASSIAIKPIKIQVSSAAKEPIGTGTGKNNSGNLAQGRLPGSVEEKNTAEEIKRTISQYFGLEVKQITVYFRTE